MALSVGQNAMYKYGTPSCPNGLWGFTAIEAVPNLIYTKAVKAFCQWITGLNGKLHLACQVMQ